MVERRKTHRPKDLPWYLRTAFADIAVLYQVSDRKVRDWKAMGSPELQKEQIDLREFNKWYIEAIATQQSIDGRKNAEIVAAIQELKVVEQKQKVRAANLKYSREIKTLVPRTWVDDVMDLAIMVLQRCGENLRRHHGDDAQKMLLDALTTIQTRLNGMWREHEVPTQEPEPKPKRPRKKAAKRKPTKKKATKKKKG